MSQKKRTFLGVEFPKKGYMFFGEAFLLKSP